jgi:hypothetical protein
MPRFLLAALSAPALAATTPAGSMRRPVPDGLVGPRGLSQPH